MYTQSPHDGLCKIRIGRNQIYTYQFLNEKNLYFSKNVWVFLENVWFLTVCVGEWKCQDRLNLYFFENSKQPYHTHTQFLRISIGSSPPWH